MPEQSQAPRLSHVGTLSAALALVPPSPAQAQVYAVTSWITPTGLDLPDGLPFDVWQAVGEQLKLVERSLMWLVGDWMLYGEGNYGERFSQALDASDYAPQTIENATWVARSISRSRRRESLSWSHHAEVASRQLTPEQQDMLLDIAEAEALTTKELRIYRRRLEQGRPLPEGPTSLVNYGETAAEYFKADNKVLLEALETINGCICDYPPEEAIEEIKQVVLCYVANPRKDGYWGGKDE